jgi:hypothetical protein
MLSVEQIEEWLGQDVLDVDGERIGKLDEVYYSAGSGETMFALVTRGLLGRHRSLVPLTGASVGRDYLKLAYSTERIETASVKMDAKDTLGQEEARQLGAAYGVEVPLEDFESATLINQGRLAAQEARERAEELDREAQRRAADADEAQSTAQDASEQAAQKIDRADQARAEADHAQSEAQRITPP